MNEYVYEYVCIYDCSVNCARMKRNFINNNKVFNTSGQWGFGEVDSRTSGEIYELPLSCGEWGRINKFPLTAQRRAIINAACQFRNYCDGYRTRSSTSSYGILGLWIQRNGKHTLRGLYKVAKGL